MAKVLSDTTAKWIQQQINKRDLTSKSRPGVILGGGGGSNSFLARVTARNSDGSINAKILPNGNGGPEGDEVKVWFTSTPVCGSNEIPLGSLIVISAVPAQMAQVEIS